MSARHLRPRTRLARKLRADSTDVERILWRALREHLPLLKFRRQHPIGKRIADFACASHKLVIELDGSQHGQRTAADEARTVELATNGYRVMRFWNNEVLDNLEEVLATVHRELETPHLTQPSPPLRGGEGTKP